MVHERIVTVPLDQPLVICAPAEASLVTTEGARVLASTKGRILAPVPPWLRRFDVVRRGRRLGLLFPSLREVDGGRRDEQRRGAGARARGRGVRHAAAAATTATSVARQCYRCRRRRPGHHLGIAAPGAALAVAAAPVAGVRLYDCARAGAARVCCRAVEA